MEDAELADAVVAELGGRTVACAESCTVGRLTQEFAAVDGAESWFRGGIVAYQVEVKRALLGVTAPSVLNEEAAATMAAGVASLLAADVSVSTTGLLGGEPRDGISPGTVFVATSVDGMVTSRTHRFDLGPEDVLEAAVRQALRDLLIDLVQPQEPH